MFIESMNIWCRPLPQYHCMVRQPGLTYRRTCPSIPGLGAGGTPPKIDASTDWIYRLTHSTHRTHGTISPIQEESYPYNGMLDYPHIPRLPHIIVGGVYGVKNDIFYFCWGGAFPLSRLYVVNPYALDWGCPHPSIHLSSGIPTQP